MQELLLAAGVLLVLQSAVTAHKLVWFASCPKPEGMPGFNFTAFQNAWYVRNRVKTGSSCLVDAFYQEDGTLKYKEKQLSKTINSIINFDSDMVPVEGKEAKYEVEYSTFLPDSILTVLDTDYNSYAVLFVCQDWPWSLFCRKSGSILVRSLEEELDFESMYQLLEENGVDRDDIDMIDHTDCATAEEANFVFNIDGVNVGLGGKIGGQITDSLGKLHDIINTKDEEPREHHEDIDNSEEADVSDEESDDVTGANVEYNMDYNEIK